MRLFLFIPLLLIPLEAEPSEVTPQILSGTVTPEMVKTVFGQQSVLSIHPELGSAHRIFPENDHYNQIADVVERSKQYIEDSPHIFRTGSEESELIIHENRYTHLPIPDRLSL